MKIASIDIGSNSIKLVVVDAAASDSFAVRAVECITRFRSIAEARGAEEIIAVATASVREASNSAQFIKEIQRRAAVTVEVLSPLEEGRLIGLAAAQACADAAKSIL